MSNQYKIEFPEAKITILSNNEADVAKQVYEIHLKTLADAVKLSDDICFLEEVRKDFVWGIWALEKKIAELKYPVMMRKDNVD